MLTKNIKQMKIEVAEHIKADAVVQRIYWEGGKGCFIGCLTHSDEARNVTDKFGMPTPLVKLCENIFEALPINDAKEFFSKIPNAIGSDGKDLSRVVWKFLASELRALPAQKPEIQKVIDPVIEGMDFLSEGEEWPAAAADAADAARAAAARLRQKEAILKLISQSPIAEVV